MKRNAGLINASSRYLHEKNLIPISLFGSLTFKINFISFIIMILTLIGIDFLYWLCSHGGKAYVK
jgi:hypothetical protein